MSAVRHPAWPTIAASITRAGLRADLRADLREYLREYLPPSGPHPSFTHVHSPPLPWYPTTLLLQRKRAAH